MNGLREVLDSLANSMDEKSRRCGSGDFNDGRRVVYEAASEAIRAAIASAPAPGGRFACSGYVCPACSRCYECHSKDLHATPQPPSPISDEAEYPEAAQVCAEAYQVVGCLLSDLGIFDTDRAEKILDNLSQHRKVHDDVLPWPSMEQPPTDSSQRGGGLPELPKECDLVFAADAEGYDWLTPGKCYYTPDQMRAYAQQCRSARVGDFEQSVMRGTEVRELNATIARLTAEVETLCNVIDGHAVHVAVEAQAAHARQAIVGAKP